MTAVTKLRMNADEFIAWAMNQPKGQRYELVGGEVVAMAPERSTRAPSWTIISGSLPCDTT